jgi:hypothetical protein
MTTTTIERRTERPTERPTGATTWVCENCRAECRSPRKRCTECGTSRF